MSHTTDDQLHKQKRIAQAMRRWFAVRLRRRARADIANPLIRLSRAFSRVKAARRFRLCTPELYSLSIRFITPLSESAVLGLGLAGGGGGDPGQPPDPKDKSLQTKRD